jgi:hypothetical protein
MTDVSVYMNPRRFALAVLLPSLASAQAPDVEEILRKSDEAGQKNGIQSDLYAYREFIVNTELDKNGKQQSQQTETWDVIGLEGAPYRRLILHDEKPLSTKEQKSEDKRLAEETKKRQRENKPPKNKVFSFSYSLHFGRESMHLFDVSYLGEETVNGRLAYIIEGVPKPTARPANDNEKELLHYRVKRWIDKQDLIDARIDLEVVSAGSRMQPGTLITTVLHRLDGGVWVVSETQIDYSLRFFKVAGARGKQVSTRTDFHKFEVSSRVVDGPQ